MSDSTGISWTNKTCSACQASKPFEAFAHDSSHADGRTSVCRECRNGRQRSKYTPKGRRSRAGILLAPTRDGDKKQARARVNHLVEVGRIPHPNDLPCVDCADECGFDSARHEYDHSKGYDGENQMYVEPVCTTCHHAREEARCG